MNVIQREQAAAMTNLFNKYTDIPLLPYTTNKTHTSTKVLDKISPPSDFLKSTLPSFKLDFQKGKYR